MKHLKIIGSAIMELLNKNNIDIHVERLGIPDRFIEHGAQSILKENIGIDKESIKKKIIEMTR